MNEAVISVTEAAEDLRKIVQRARAESVSFVMTDNGIPVARIVPESEKICTGADLAEALSNLQDIPTDFSDWREDLRAAKSFLIAPTDKWE